MIDYVAEYMYVCLMHQHLNTHFTLIYNVGSLKCTFDSLKETTAPKLASAPMSRCADARTLWPIWARFGQDPAIERLMERMGR